MAGIKIIKQAGELRVGELEAVGNIFRPAVEEIGFTVYAESFVGQGKNLAEEGGVVWVGLVAGDRWLSHSGEADRLHTGDSLGELIREELVELGEEGPPVVCEHFRDEDRLFTFRTPVPRAWRCGSVIAIGRPRVACPTPPPCRRRAGVGIFTRWARS